MRARVCVYGNDTDVSFVLLQEYGSQWDVDILFRCHSQTNASLSIPFLLLVRVSPHISGLHLNKDFVNKRFILSVGH